MRTKIGTALPTKMAKTAIIRVDRYVVHPKYGKRYRLSKKFYAHDEEGTVSAGDTVTIAESRPLSRLKRWTVTAVQKNDLIS